MAAAEEVIRRCRELARVSEEEGRLTRRFATPAMARANALVGRWMSEAGMAVRVDAAGNLVGHLPGSDPEAGTLLLGSHLDTVRDAGAFDGPLGVLAAVACVARLRAQDISLPFAVDVLGFSDEEGLRYGTAYLGSRAVAGTFDPAALDLVDEGGVTMRDALAAFGTDEAGVTVRDVLAADEAGGLVRTALTEGIERASRRGGERLLGYCELHIEQGPILEQCDVPVAVVTAIAGASRAEVRFTGRAGHAGTVPMDVRRDAACALAEFVLAVEHAGRAAPGLVATVGQLAALPGAPNVVPGAAVASLDVRHADDAIRVAAVGRLRDRARAIAAARRLEVAWEERLDSPAVAMDTALTERLTAAVAEIGLPDIRLPSGAGHDAVALADLTAVAMLFVRCAGGVSHHPDESVDVADVAVALDVLDRFLRGLA